MKKNPFSLTFGKEPIQMISRYTQMNMILESFTDEAPGQQIYMITGVRGSGKTVFMTSVAKSLQEKKEWIVIELNSSGELLKELAAKLYNAQGFSSKFKTAGINLSFWGIGVDIKKYEPITDLGTAIERMLERIAKENKRVLITIDEVSNTDEMRQFAGAFQIMVRHDHPLFLLMTGLYENINKLQNEKNLTFLYRAPKIYLPALNLFRISDTYEKQLKLTKEEALELAKKTMGYSFAFQVVGYFTFSKNGDFESAFPEIRQYLDEYVYDKIWIELSVMETDILCAISVNGYTQVRDIKEQLKLKPNEFSVYRDRLIKKGILNGSVRGSLTFALPYFEDYIKEHADF